MDSGVRGFCYIKKFLKLAFFFFMYSTMMRLMRYWTLNTCTVVYIFLGGDWFLGVLYVFCQTGWWWRGWDIDLTKEQ